MVIRDGMRHVVVSSMGVFYADDGIIGSWDSEWLQGGLHILIILFRHISLMANFAKSKTMTC